MQCPYLTEMVWFCSWFFSQMYYFQEARLHTFRVLYSKIAWWRLHSNWTRMDISSSLITRWELFIHLQFIFPNLKAIIYENDRVKFSQCQSWSSPIYCKSHFRSTNSRVFEFMLSGLTKRWKTYYLMLQKWRKILEGGSEKAKPFLLGHINTWVFMKFAIFEMTRLDSFRG